MIMITFSSYIVFFPDSVLQEIVGFNDTNDDDGNISESGSGSWTSVTSNDSESDDSLREVMLF